MGKNAKERADNLKKIRTASAVARALKVKRKNSILFPAVAAALGKPWPLNMRKRQGYALIMEYAAIHGIRFVTAAMRKREEAANEAAVTKPEFLESYAWRRLRMEVIKKRGARCECCGADPKDGKTVINVDHIKPRRLFTELALEESNLQVLCHQCNHGKGNWDQTDWRTPESEGPVH